MANSPAKKIGSKHIRNVDSNQAGYHYPPLVGKSNVGPPTTPPQRNDYSTNRENGLRPVGNADTNQYENQYPPLVGKSNGGAAHTILPQRIDYSNNGENGSRQIGNATATSATATATNTSQNATKNEALHATTNEAGPFLEIIRLLKSEILQTLNQKISAITAQFEQIQQAKSPQPSLMMFRQQLPPTFPPYPQQQYFQQ